MDKPELDRLVFALLFASDEPLTVKRVSQILEISSTEINRSLESIRSRLNGENASVMLEAIAGGYQLSTRPEFANYIARLYSGKRKQRLSKAALETLAIIAYKQPITRAEIESIRGVSCGGVITTLMERTLIRIIGKAKVLGAPFLYGTTQEFLEYLGLNDLKDLPSLEELESMLEREEFGEEQTGGETTKEADSLDGERSKSYETPAPAEPGMPPKQEGNTEPERLEEASEDAEFGQAQADEIAPG